MMEQTGLTPSHFAVVSALVFYVGFLGMILNKRSLINVLLCLEILLLAVTINFVAFAHFLSDLFGQVAAFFILSVAAAEAAIGLAIVMVIFRSKGTIGLDAPPLLKSDTLTTTDVRSYLASFGLGRETDQTATGSTASRETMTRVTHPPREYDKPSSVKGKDPTP